MCGVIHSLFACSKSFLISRFVFCDIQDMFKAEDDDESEINEKLKDMSLEKHWIQRIARCFLFLDLNNNIYCCYIRIKCTFLWNRS